MECGDQSWNGPGKPRETWAWAILGSLAVHGLILAVLLAALRNPPPPRRLVVPVEAVTLVPFKTGPSGDGGTRPASVTRPEPVPPKKAAPRVCPPPKPRVKPRPRPKVKPAPPPAPAKAPVIPTPAPPAARTRPHAAPAAATTSRAGAPEAAAGGSGAGQGGRAGGRGAGSGMGSGQGRGSGSALSGYLREIRRLLEQHQDYPWMARRRNLQGVVAVVFTIGSRGQIESARISRSSGHALLDAAARDTIRRIGQFPPFPAALHRQKLTIEVPLAFRLSHE